MNWSDIVGLDSAKQALLLLAVDPSLGGVAMAAAVGSGKSTLARAFAALLPDGTPFVELPLNITEDRLIGGLNLEAALATGQRVVEQGLLAKADGGVLNVDGLNLLDDAVVTQVMDAMSRGEVRIEREGLSAVHAAHFMLMGTYDSNDGNVRGGLLDRIGLIVPFVSNGDTQARAEVVRRNIAAPLNSLEQETDEMAMLRGMIGFAREQLSSITISDEQLEGIAQAALSLGVEGNRADVFAAKAALAHAALSGRDAVDDEDLQAAAKLVLMPRATRLPEPEQQPDQPPPQQEQQPKPEQQQQDEDTPEPPQPEAQPQIEELLLSAVEAALPGDVLNLPFTSRRGKSGSRGVQLNDKRGKFVRAVQGEMRGHKLALLPTLLAAAPWQKMRRETEDGRRKTAGDERPTPSLNRPPSSVSRLSSVLITKEDIRVKKFRDKAGTLFVFVVDASGSMALNRMRQAKGAVARLLQNAYVHRDRVALVSFRGQQAQVLLAPSQSVEQAKRELDVLPTGGGTPLASALMLGWDMAQQSRRKGIPNTTLIVMTDGRGNVGISGERGAGGKERLAAGGQQPTAKQQIEDELKQLSALIAADGVGAVVIDTQANYLSRGEAPRLAKWLDGRYVYLPNAKAGQIVAAIDGAG